MRPAEEGYESDQEQFCDSAYSDDQVASIAMIGRLNADKSLAMLTEAVVAKTRSLSEYAAWKKEGRAVCRPAPFPPQKLSVVMEQLYWLVYMMSYLLADSTEVKP